jgi:hypothetical protein
MEAFFVTLDNSRADSSEGCNHEGSRMVCNYRKGTCFLVSCYLHVCKTIDCYPVQIAL